MSYFRVLCIIHNLIKSNSITTKRDIYYRDVELFETQSAVDKIVDNLAYSFGVQRLELNIVASPKGLVYGDLTIVTKNGTAIEFEKSNGVRNFEKAKRQKVTNKI